MGKVLVKGVKIRGGWGWQRWSGGLEVERALSFCTLEIVHTIFMSRCPDIYISSLYRIRQWNRSVENDLWDILLVSCWSGNASREYSSVTRTECDYGRGLVW